MTINKVFSDLGAWRPRESIPTAPVKAAAPIPDVRAALLAGGLGERMGKVTDAVCKPMVPYAGACRLVDFSVANRCTPECPSWWSCRSIWNVICSITSCAVGRPGRDARAPGPYERVFGPADRR